MDKKLTMVGSYQNSNESLINNKNNSNMIKVKKHTLKNPTNKSESVYKPFQFQVNKI